MKNILILGASGTVGQAIYTALSNTYHVTGTYHRQPAPGLTLWEITDLAGLDQLIQSTQPHVIISALTGDFDTQLGAHRHLAHAVAGTGAHLIYFSTANVFDGLVDRPHAELDTPRPVSLYGQFKLHCEGIVQGENTLIVRIPKVITPAVADQFIFGQPVYENIVASFISPGHIATAIKGAIENRTTGILHLSSQDFMPIPQALSCLGKTGFDTQPLTLEGYANMMGAQPADITPAADGQLYLVLASVRGGTGMTCADVLLPM